MARRSFLLLLAGVLSIAGMASVAASHVFVDVPDSHVFHTDIAWIAGQEITKGCNPAEGNTKYCPDAYVTRGQMAAFLDRALALPSTGTDYFDDDNSNIFEGSINRLAAADITKGCNPAEGNTKYCPHDYVTRGQMAAFLVRALNLFDDGGTDHFTDDNGSVFELSINKLATAGVTSGCNPAEGNTRYCPHNYVTRGQMAAFLRRGLLLRPWQVEGLVVTLGGGSGEIEVSWDAAAELDVAGYNVYHSELSGGAKTLIVNPYQGPDTKPGDRWYIIDWPRSQVSGQDCYQVAAVDAFGQVGNLSIEECFDSTPGPPNQVTGVTVGTGGGSGEAYVSWTPNGEGDMNYYNVYYSEFPGGPWVWEASVDEAVRDGSSRVFYIDWPVDLTVGKTCYVIGAVDLNEKEGPASTEACFMP